MARFFSNEISDFLLSEINTNLKIALGLKIIQKGRLDLVIDDNTLIKNYLPAIYLDLGITIDEVLILESYEMSYNFRIIYVNGFDPSTEFIKNKYTETEKIAEMLIDRIQLSGLTLINGGIISNIMSSINYTPSEEKELQSIYGDIYASAIDFVVKVQTQK